MTFTVNSRADESAISNRIMPAGRRSLIFWRPETVTNDRPEQSVFFSREVDTGSSRIQHPARDLRETNERKTVSFLTRLL